VSSCLRLLAAAWGTPSGLRPIGLGYLDFVSLSVLAPQAYSKTLRTSRTSREFLKSSPYFAHLSYFNHHFTAKINKNKIFVLLGLTRVGESGKVWVDVSN
jgi:hypothetical protein